MSGIVFEKLKNLYKPRTNLDGFKPEQIQRMAESVVTVLTRPIAKNDNAMLTVITSTLEQDIENYLIYSMGSKSLIDYTYTRLTNALTYLLCHDHIGFELYNDAFSSPKPLVSVSNAQNAILQENIKFLSNATEVFTQYKNTKPRKGALLHPNYYIHPENQARRFAELICSGISPFEQNVISVVGNAPDDVVNNPVHQLFYVSKTNEALLKTRAITPEKWKNIPHRFGIWQTSKDYLSRFNTILSNYKLKEFLDSYDETTDFSKLVFDDTPLGLKLLSKTRGVKDVVELHYKLLQVHRRKLVEQDGKIELSSMSVSQNSLNAFFKLHEDVLYTRAAMSRLNAFFSVLADQFSTVKNRASWDELLYSLKEFLTLTPESARKYSASIAMASCVDLEQKGIAKLLSQLCTLNANEIGEYGHTNLLSCLHHLPTPTLNAMINDEALPKAWVSTIVDATVSRIQSHFFTLLPELTLGQLATLFSDAEKRHPGIFKRSDALSTLQETLVKFDKSHDSNLGSYFASVYSKAFYGEMTTGNNGAKADVTFLKGLEV